MFHWFYRAGIIFHPSNDHFPNGQSPSTTGIPAPSHRWFAGDTIRGMVPRCCSETVTGGSKSLGMGCLTWSMNAWDLIGCYDVQTTPAKMQWPGIAGTTRCRIFLQKRAAGCAVTFSLHTYLIMRISVPYYFPTFSHPVYTCIGFSWLKSLWYFFRLRGRGLLGKPNSMVSWWYICSLIFWWSVRKTCQNISVNHSSNGVILLAASKTNIIGL